MTPQLVFPHDDNCQSLHIIVFHDMEEREANSLLYRAISPLMYGAYFIQINSLILVFYIKKQLY